MNNCGGLIPRPLPIHRQEFSNESSKATTFHDRDSDNGGPRFGLVDRE